MISEPNKIGQFYLSTDASAAVYMNYLSSHVMQIVAPNPFQKIEEHDRILRRLLAQRAHEWRAQRGIRRLITRIRIEFWAWEETAREQRRIRKDDSPHRL